MNMNMLFNMFTRLVMRRAMNWGINKGVAKMSRGKGKPPVGGQPGAGQGRGQPNGSADLARKMRTLSRLTRR
ncbi:hypothetical protein E4191_13430 [Paracoccus liaowanqingii]|uniref:Uncharacterized protein n=1 Tax=Paracoccus liaowanqingii TaxID=2560053 RepID=A0A4P7HMZ5_9RHOB|nr:hypothetical protein [Paracoccus liaowanqingii]QBX35585.1 hypothetical protein E4191_13430 [Paracoccus liaowanqingii]